MRPVRFVALSEDGQALVLADEVGRLLALPIDERVAVVLHAEPGAPTLAVAPTAADPVPSLSPRDIQARIRSGESAEDVARIAGVPVDRVLRYAGPVLQERAMLAQHARRTRLKGAEKPTPLADVVNGRLAQHGIDTEKISWDAWRRDDGTWRIVATWPSGKATAQAVWDLDKTRQSVSPHDDMAQYLCAERPTPILGQEPAPERGGHTLPGPSRGEPSRGGHGLPAPAEPGRSGRDPIRAGRDALLASLDRPLGSTSGRGLDPRSPAALAGSQDAPRQRAVTGGAAALLGGGQGSAFDDDADAPKEVPAVPSLAVLRPRRTNTPAASAAESTEPGAKPRKRLPSWDDVLFGTGPAARESS
ncbi:septation protein SepH [Micromonospora sp. WMMD1082]|uniref:septation protein SepH n=1 Tax=Micromonospora sp. WMMD1082 TaxID=3016104 RepID=UPI0024169C88|nr:septation protein SepH [Micromonospora sp. WMMD1082]MDG4795794.1 septation protein SepH [Micromonospora sp. WMMD1082]